MNQMGEKTKQLAHGMAAQKEALIKKAISHAAGNDKESVFISFYGKKVE